MHASQDAKPSAPVGTHSGCASTSASSSSRVPPYLAHSTTSSFSDNPGRTMTLTEAAMPESLAASAFACPVPVGSLSARRTTRMPFNDSVNSSCHLSFLLLLAPPPNGLHVASRRHPGPDSNSTLRNPSGTNTRDPSSRRHMAGRRESTLRKPAFYSRQPPKPPFPSATPTSLFFLL